jgi:NADH-quinone oxidoreductase subunit C
MSAMSETAPARGLGPADELAARFAAALELSGGPVTGEDVAGTPGVAVPPERWHDALAFARDGLGLDFFDWLSAVDETDAEPAGFDVVTHLVNASSEHGLRRLLLRTRVPEGVALPSATDLWPGAAWHERETFEMFGIAFEGFGDGTGLGLRPLLLPEGFEGTPLRKSFVLAARASKPWPGAKEPGESDAHPGSPGRRKLLPPGVPASTWGPRPPGAPLEDGDG